MKVQDIWWARDRLLWPGGVGARDAFGLHDPKKIETVPLNRFKEERPVPGMVSIDDRAGTVSRVIGRKVSIDFSHP